MGGGPCGICVSKMPFVLLYKELNIQYKKLNSYWAPFVVPGGPPEAFFQCHAMRSCILELMKRCKMIIQENLFKCSCGHLESLLEQYFYG